MDFTIDESYITTVTKYKEWSIYDGKDTLTDEELIKKIKGLDLRSSTSTDDHPEFAKLRTMLSELGYVEVQGRWWNGDRVIKPFTLNGKQFDIGDQFLSSAAMKWYLKSKK